MNLFKKWFIQACLPISLYLCNCNHETNIF